MYAWSLRLCRGLDELTYPFHDTTITVTDCGRIRFEGRKVNLSHAFARQNVGVTQVGERISARHLHLGPLRRRDVQVEPIENPFGSLEMLPMCP